MKYKIAIFDLDGTVLDTIEDLTDTMNFCLRKYSMPEHSLAAIKSFVGNGIHKLVERAVPAESSAELVEELYALFNEHYIEHCLDKTKPYEGILALITELRACGTKTALVSNKADYAVQPMIKHYFDGLFDDVMGTKEGIERKPCPDGVNMVLRRHGISPKEAVYIGDTMVDYQTALNAGTDIIVVSYGFRSEKQLRASGVERSLPNVAALRQELLF